MHITHAIYLVEDLVRARQFLQGVLGFEVTADEQTVDGERFFTMAAPGGDLHLQLVESAVQPKIAALKAQIGVVDFILSVADIEAVLARVAESDLPVTRPPLKADYGITAKFADPFGNQWDLVQR